MIGSTTRRFAYALIIGMIPLVILRTNPVNGSLKEKNPSIVLITVDTLRADHLGCYGYERETSPAIDSLAKDGALFYEAITPIPKTLPSLSSLLTGLHPKTHEVFALGMRLSDLHTLLPEIMKQRRYHTGGVVGQYNCHRKFGLGQGFDFYDDHFECIIQTETAHEEGKFHPDSEKRAEYVVEKGIEWIKGLKDSPSPFFLWLHLMDPHAAYDPPGEYADYFTGPAPMTSRSYSGRYIDPELIHPYARVRGITEYDFYINKYDGEIAYMDSQVQRLFDFLKATDHYNDALIILTADHGEYMGEHDAQETCFTHGHTLFESEICVPLIIKFPGNAIHNRMVSSQVSLVDIFPTVLAVIGEQGVPCEGKNLLDLLEKGDTTHDSAAFIQLKEGKGLAVRKDRYKLIVETKYPVKKLIRRLKKHRNVGIRYTLYDLLQDPLERSNVYKNNRDAAMHLAEELFDWLAMSGTPDAGYAPINMLDEQTIQHLKSLGYIQTGE
ncbi:MAG: sulfatase [bacterium]